MATRLRPATQADLEFLYQIRTDPAVVAGSLQEPPTDEVHRAWIAEALANPDIDMLIVEAFGKPAGTARLNLMDYGRWAIVSIALIESARGQGVGTEALRLLSRRARDHHRLMWIQAEIREGNTASRRAFLRAGYTVEGIDDGVVTVTRQIAQAM